MVDGQKYIFSFFNNEEFILTKIINIQGYELNREFLYISTLLLCIIF